MKLTDSKKALVGCGIQLGALLMYLATALSYDHVAGLVFGVWFFVVVFGMALVILGRSEQKQEKRQMQRATPTESH
jgi:hypothetical protein